MPSYETAGSAGADLKASLDEPITLTCFMETDVKWSATKNSVAEVGSYQVIMEKTGVTIDFYIYADDDDRPAAGQPAISAGLTFSVQASGGREFSLDSELQRDGAYNIIIPSM